MKKVIVLTFLMFCSVPCFASTHELVHKRDWAYLMINRIGIVFYGDKNSLKRNDDEWSYVFKQGLKESSVVFYGERSCKRDGDKFIVKTSRKETCFKDECEEDLAEDTEVIEKGNASYSICEKILQ